MTDIGIFFDFYSRNKKHDIIRYGFEKSEFNGGVEFNKICQSILERRSYLMYSLDLSGLPRKFSGRPKITYDKSFNVLTDNLQTIPNYELAKYVLFRINSDHLLQRIRMAITEDGLMRQTMIRYFKLFLMLYNRFGYKVVKGDMFRAKIRSNPFYQKHETDIISGVINGINTDLETLNDKSSGTVAEIRETLLSVLDIIIMCSDKSRTITINNLNDLILNDLQEFDVGYEGSFMQLWKNYCTSGSDTTELIREYGLKNLLNELFIKIDENFVRTINQLKELHPEYDIVFSDDFKNEFTNILFDFYIHLGLKISEEHAMNKCFGQSSKIHFKTLYTSITQLLKKGDEYNDTQLLVLHYALLSSDKLEHVCECDVDVCESEDN